jgi:dihydroflavonol-4-reductase
MEKILVTGATGFVGAALVKELLRKGHRVRITVRQNSNRRNIVGLAVEEVQTDILDREGMRRALDGCSRLYHVAGLYRTWMRDYDRLKKVNVEGTRSVLEAALEDGVEKVVYTSSIAALGLRQDGKLSDENTPFNLYHVKSPYDISKYESEKVAVEFYKKGLPVVIVRPALVMGEGDIYPTPSGNLVLDILKGKIPSYFDGGIDVVDVGDVAVGHIYAMEKGRPGESYNLGCKDNFITMKNLFTLIAEVGGVTPPKIRVPNCMALAWALTLTAISDHITHREPVTTPDSIRTLSLKRRVDFSKAVSELGIPQTPLRDIVARTVNWYRKEGYV